MRQEKNDVTRKKLVFCFSLDQKGLGETIILLFTGLFPRFSRLARVFVRASQSGVKSQPSKKVFFTVIRQKCRLILNVKKFQGISNLILLAHLHGLLAPEEALNWKNQFHNYTLAGHCKTLITTCLRLKIFGNFISGERPRKPPKLNS